MTPLLTVLDGDDDLTFTDVFCGAGGSSIGLTEAGFRLKLAANHWDRAIETHAANFRDADHLQADVSNYDWRRAPRTKIGWFSPECTWHSPAGGRARIRQQLDMFDEHVPTDAGIRSRATAFDVIRATEVHRYAAVIVENVVEFAAWEMFDWWLRGLEQVGPGYNVQIVCVSSAHIGGPGNPHAPQWRDRMYVVATRKGIPLPDVAPRPPAWCSTCEEVVAAKQSWKRAGRRVGKYGSQYLYRCPNVDRCRSSVVEPFVLPASAAIDWTDLGTRIGDRKRPLAAATMRRIEAGIRMFAQPAVVQAHGQTYERPGSGYYRAWPSGGAPLNVRTGTGADGIASPPGAFFTKAYTPRSTPEQMVKPVDGQPLGAVTASDHHDLVVPPGAFGVTLRKHADVFSVGQDALSTLSTTRHDGVVTPFIDVARTNNRPRGVDEPLSPVTTGRNHSVVTPPFIDTARTGNQPGSVDDPLTAVTGRSHHALAVPPGAFIQKHHGGVDYAGIEHMVKSVDDPLPSLVARVNTSLVIPYRRGSNPRAADGSPLPAVATREHAALLSELAVDAADCLFRMLKPREHLRAQRFPDSYVVLGNQGEQTMQAGNAVSSNVAHWLGRALRAVL